MIGDGIEKVKLLVVDDEENIRVQLKWALANDYQILTAGSREEAMAMFDRELPPVVMLDLGLPPDTNGAEEGLATLQHILARNSQTKVIVVTGNSEKGNAIRAIHMGAYDYYYKPMDMEEIRVIIRRALHLFQLEGENAILRQVEHEGRFDQIVGNSREMRTVFSMIRKVARSDATILVIGESGTGKELIARAIHQFSLRKEHPFIPINCGAIPENLMESELFGSEKGAFTGAHAQRRGKVEYAHGGTLFLDEIGELSLQLQVKLLRFLQERRIERVGGRESLEVDARVLAATNVDLKKAVEDGRFREDLYYRLSVVTISVPPLRSREDDVLLLARTFFERFVEENKKKKMLRGFSKASLDALYSYRWPGNVRELENKVKRAVIMAEGELIEPVDLDIHIEDEPYGVFSLKEAKERVEVDLIKKALVKNAGNITYASKDLGISRPSLHDLLHKHQIKYDGPAD